MELLAQIFNKQAGLAERLLRERSLLPMADDVVVRHPIAPDVLISGREAWAMGLITAIQSEAAEAMDWLPWKWWKNRKPTDWVELDKEFIDILHFVVQYFIVRGISPDVFARIYAEKMAENHARQEGKVAGREDYEVSK